jgi:DNA-binding MarR family transcriptional regulator
MTESTRKSAGEIAERCLAAHARLLARVISGVYDDGLRPVGLTSSQMIILTALEYSGGAQPAQLCEALKLDKSTLSRNVERMERNGWIEREPCNDARSHVLRLTEEGRKRFNQAVPLWKEAQSQAEALLGKGGTSAISKVSRRLRGF